MESGIQPVMNVGAGYGDGYGFGGNGLWLFAILALMNGGFWGNRDGRCATVEDLSNQSNFTRLENQVMGNGQAIAQGFRNVDNAVCQIGYQNLQNTAALSSQLADCCCNTQRAVDSVKFDMANYAAAINANTTAGVQKILDKLCEDKVQALQSRVNLLEMQNLVQPPRAIPAYPACNPYTGVYSVNGCTGCNI